MFGNNPFGALSEEQSSNAVAGPSLSQIDGEETDADWLELRKTNGEVYVRVSDPVDLEGLPMECNLMAVSNLYGLVAVGGQSDVRIHRLDEIHRLLEESAKDALPVSSPLGVLPLPARPVWVRFAEAEEKLVVATIDGSGVCLFDLKDVVGGTTTPYATITTEIPSHLLDVLPNPAAFSKTDELNRNTALLSKEGFAMLDTYKGKVGATIPGAFTCGCWSAKGKQIIIGTKAGTLDQYTPEGSLKSRIPAPPELEESQYYPTFVRWLETDSFVACYARIDAEDPRDPLEVFVIQRTKQSITYTKYFDINDTMGVENRSGNHRYLVDLKQWGSTSKHLGFMASGIGTEIGVLHGAAEGAGSTWQAVFLGEMARGVLPGAKKGVSDEDTSVLAMEADLTATKPVVRGMEGGVDLSDLPPPPRLLVYSQAGLLISFDVRYPDVGPYPGMISPQSIDSVPTRDRTSTVTDSAPPGDIQPKPKTTFSGFGSSTLPSSTPAKPAFGASPFGQSSTTPAFGASAFGSSAFGSTTPSSSPAPSSAFGQSAFGSTTPTASPAPKSAFGQTAFGSTTPSSTPAPKTAFGQSAFGTATPSSTPPPKTAFGQSAFGATTPSSTPDAKPAFGQSAFGSTTPAPKSAFGQSAFGSTTPSSTPGAKPAFGQSGFGSTTPSSTPDSKLAFGQSAFGAFGSGSTTPTAKPTFGQTSIPAFGQSSQPSAASPFGQTAFGQSSKPAFGSSSFGQSSFGGTSTSAPAETKPQPAASGSAFGQSAFGQSAFGQSAFGQSSKPAESAKSAFGQPAENKESSASKSTAFGGSAFGGSSAFGTAASKTSNPDKPIFGSSANPFASAASGSSGSSPFGGPGGGFGTSAFGKPATSAFDSKPVFGVAKSSGPSPSTESAKPTGLFGSTKPATSPDAGADDDDFGLGGFASALGASSGPAKSAPAQRSTPGGKPRVPGLEDSDEEDDDNAAKPTTSSTSSGTSSFIKPATGFSQASLGGFGAFGQATKAPTTVSTAKPNALSATPPPKSAFGASSTPTGGVAFGQTSTPAAAFGKPSTPGTSNVAFGQTSAPVAFGQAAKPAAPAVGNITGGFGGFGKSSSGGFGGFASASTGESIFAKKDEKPLVPAALPFGAKAAGGNVPVFGQKPDSSVSVFGTQKTGPETVSVKTEPAAIETSTRASIFAPKPEPEAEKPAVVPEPAVTPAGYADKQPESPKSPIAASTVKPEIAAIPAGYDVPGAVVDSADSDHEDDPPVAIETASAVPLPPPESQAPLRLPPIESIAAVPLPGSANEPSLSAEGGDVSPTRSLEEGVLVEHEEVPPAPFGQEAVEEYDSDNEYDDEYDYEEEVEGEGEEYDSDEDEDPTLRRRRSGSLAPHEMSPIAEEPSELDESEERDDDDDGGSFDDEEASEDGEEDASGEDDDEHAKPTPKSPPAWFAKTASPGPSVPSAEGTASGSLFGRIGSEPTSESSTIPSIPKLPPPFSLKHAVKTSSPLGQPPETAHVSPPVSPEKAPASSFGFFGAEKPGQSVFGSSKSAFGQGLGIGKPPGQPVKSPVEEKPSVFGGFGQSNTPVDGQKSVFGGFGTTPKAPEAENKSPFGGFGLSKATPAAPPASSGGLFAGFGQTAQSTPPASSSGGLFSSDPSTTPAPVQAPPTPQPAAPPTSFSIPPRQAAPKATPVPDDGKRTMTAVLDRLISALLGDIEQLRSTLAQNKRYHDAFTIGNFPKVIDDNLDKHTTLPFSSLNDVRAIVTSLATEVDSVVAGQAGIDTKLANVQSRLLKTDMKVGQADKFVKARQDPSFAAGMQMKDLSLDQAESQARLRQMIEITEHSLSELEAGIANLQKRADFKGDASDTSNEIDKMQKSVRDVDATIRDQAELIDELSSRISSLRVGSAGRQRGSSQPVPSPAKPVPAQPGPRSAQSTIKPSAHVVKTVDDALARQAKIRAKLLARSGKVAPLNTLDPKSGGKGVLSHVSLVDGPISIAETPLPGTVDVEVESTPTATIAPSTTTPGTTTSLPSVGLTISPSTTNAPPTSGMFSNITFGKLDPGTFARPAAGERKADLSSGSSSRGHSSAPKFIGGGSSPASARSDGGFASASSPVMSFVPPPDLVGDDTGKKAPSGFFSLSGFQK